MNSFIEGSKYFVVSENGLHWLNPFFEESAPCHHSNTVPYWFVFNPRCVLYHSLIFFGSLHLKKIPPIPVTFFIFVFLFVLEIIVLKVNPNKNEVAITI